MLVGNQVYLRPLSLEDVSEDYIAWMNDYEIVKYTESRFTHSTRSSIEAYVGSANNQNNYTFAIICKETHLHLGSIKLANINWFHRFANIGIIIGRPEYTNKGIATECFCLITEFAFSNLNLHKVTASVYEPNGGSIHAFEKAGFTISHREKNKYFFEGQYVDAIILEKFAEQEG